MSRPVARLLIVDDERRLMRALCDTLEAEGYAASGHTSAGQALAELREESFDLMLTDLMMPEMDGISVLKQAFEIDPNLSGIVMTGHGSVNTAVDALKSGAVDYILKPFKLSAVLGVLTRALAVRRLRLENIQLKEAAALHDLSVSIASARGSSEVLDRVADAAYSQSKARGVRVLMADARGSELYGAAARGMAALPAGPIPLSQELFDWAARCGGGALDTEASPPAPLRGDAAAPLSIPMVAGAKLTGILQFAAAGAGRDFTQGQMKALHVLAGAAACALSAASLQERLRVTEQRCRHLTDNAPDIVSRYELHPRRGFVYVNAAVTAVTGYTPDEHYADPELGLKMTHAEDRHLAEKALGGEDANGSAITLRWVSKTGTMVWVEQRNTRVYDADGRLTAIESIARDITKRKNLEERLRHTQKLEAIGQVTAGVAHDFNNYLTVINGYSALALKELDSSTSVWRKVSEVKKAGDQAAALTSQLLAFSRKQILQPRAVSLKAVLSETDQMIRKAAGDSVEVVMNLADGLGLVRIDPGQVQQVILNLAVNARDAMPEGGRLLLELTDETVDESTANALSIPAGSFTKLTVSDTGCGMTPEVKQRAFEPFFTTKEMGRGTGLGLATVLGIVEQSGAHLRLESEPGAGTTFSLYFPKCEAEPEAAPAPDPGIARGSETILLVEGVPAVRSLAKGILSQAGYSVLIAEDGAAAALVARRHEGPIHLLLADMALSKAPGSDVAQRIRAIRPGIRVLFMTGYSEIAVKQAGEGSLEVIRKPFSPQELCNRVRKALGAQPRQAQRVLVVDDEEPIRNLLQEILESSGFSVETAGNGREARKQAARQAFDIVMTDLVMPDVEGIELISALRRESPQVKLIAMSGALFPDLLKAARLLGACATLAKPLSAENVMECIRSL